jgi:hypothetical protein
MIGSNDQWEVIKRIWELYYGWVVKQGDARLYIQSLGRKFNVR